MPTIIKFLPYDKQA